MQLRDGLRNVLRETRVFVFPCECAGCGVADVALCASCAEELRAQPQIVPTQHVEAPGFGPVMSGGDYGETFARVLHAIKDGGRAELARAFAPRLVDSLLAFEIRHDVELVTGRAAGASTIMSPRLVAPPSSRANRQSRGFEPLDLVARHARVTLWQPLVSVRRRADQAQLGLLARADNMRQSMSVRLRVAGVSVVLVDDLMTTGATLTEMARALNDAGAHVRGAVVLAHALRRWPTSHPREL